MSSERIYFPGSLDRSKYGKSLSRLLEIQVAYWVFVGVFLLCFGFFVVFLFVCVFFIPRKLRVVLWQVNTYIARWCNVVAVSRYLSGALGWDCSSPDLLPSCP